MNFNSHKSWHVHSKGNKSKQDSRHHDEEEYSRQQEILCKERNREKTEEDLKKLAADGFMRGDVPLKVLRAEKIAFVYEPPPGMQDPEAEKFKERPEDAIPDKPENKEAREFLKKAPSKGLWMPLGKQVKVMQCWRCKSYGHRTGDRECPLVVAGNIQSEAERRVREDPMSALAPRDSRSDTTQLTLQQKIDERKKMLDALLKAEEARAERRRKRKEEKRRKKDAGGAEGGSSEPDLGSESGSEGKRKKRKKRKKRRGSKEKEKKGRGKGKGKEKEKRRKKDRRSKKRRRSSNGSGDESSQSGSESESSSSSSSSSSSDSDSSASRHSGGNK